MTTVRVDRIVALECEIKEVCQPGGEWMARLRGLKAEQKQLLAEAELEEYFEANAELMQLKGIGSYYKDGIVRCTCGHPRGSHNSIRGCCVGNRAWNKRHGRGDPECFCRGFITPEEQARIHRIEVEEREAQRAESDHWCPECDGPVDEPTAKYECGNCGDEFTWADECTNRCPSCGKFAAKVEGDFCPDCGCEVEEL